MKQSETILGTWGIIKWIMIVGGIVTILVVIYPILHGELPIKSLVGRLGFVSLLAGGSLFSGGLFGFIFGIPSSIQEDITVSLTELIG